MSLMCYFPFFWYILRSVSNQITFNLSLEVNIKSISVAKATLSSSSTVVFCTIYFYLTMTLFSFQSNINQNHYMYLHVSWAMNVRGLFSFLVIVLLDMPWADCVQNHHCYKVHGSCCSLTVLKFFARVTIMSCERHIWYKEKQYFIYQQII